MSTLLQDGKIIISLSSFYKGRTYRDQDVWKLTFAGKEFLDNFLFMTQNNEFALVHRNPLFV